MSYWKATKLSIREDSEMGDTKESLESENLDRANKYSRLGLISGGSWRVIPGEVHSGYMKKLPKVGGHICLKGSGFSFFYSSQIREITKENENKWIVKTTNSFYELEKENK